MTAQHSNRPTEPRPAPKPTKPKPPVKPFRFKDFASI